MRDPGWVGLLLPAFVAAGLLYVAIAAVAASGTNMAKVGLLILLAFALTIATLVTASLWRR